MSPLAVFWLAAAVVAASAESAVQAGIAAALLLVALAVQISAQAGLFLDAPGPSGAPAETFDYDPREG